MGMSLARINSFSDAVFAVAITLLILNVTLPFVRHGATNAELGDALTSIWPHYLAYGISFLVIGSLWIGHHKFFDHLVRHDEVLVRLNIVYLMCVVFIPFPTNVLSLHSSTQLAVVFYAATIAVTNLFGIVSCVYAYSGKRLVDDEVQMGYLRASAVTSLVTVIVFVISIGISFASPTAAMFSWLALLPLDILVLRYYIRRGKAHAAEGESVNEAQSLE